MEFITKGGYLRNIQQILNVVGGISNRKKLHSGYVWFDGSISPANLDLILKTEPLIAVWFITDILEQKQTRWNYDLYL